APSSPSTELLSRQISRHFSSPGSSGALFYPSSGHFGCNCRSLCSAGGSNRDSTMGLRFWLFILTTAAMPFEFAIGPNPAQALGACLLTRADDVVKCQRMSVTFHFH